ncbi:MAG: prepilin-type N-terminal cleavage/methylation domain-containing protein, partial [bacterium]
MVRRFRLGQHLRPAEHVGVLPGPLRGLAVLRRPARLGLRVERAVQPGRPQWRRLRRRQRPRPHACGLGRVRRGLLPGGPDGRRLRRRQRPRPAVGVLGRGVSPGYAIGRTPSHQRSMTLNRSRSPRAFTIVELMVTVGIIALLIGLLLPGLGMV